MAFTFKCPICIAQSLTSTVQVKNVEKDVIVTRAFFDTDGSIVPPVIKQRIITLCSNNHTVTTDVNKIPAEILAKIQYFTG